MKLTRQQVLDLHNGLHSVGNLNGVKFAYAVSKNLFKMKSEVEALQETYKPAQEFVTYEGERIKLAEEHAEKTDDEPKKIMENGIQRFVIKDKKTFDKELEVLKKKYKTALESRKEQIESFEALLKEKIEIDLHKIDIKDVPKEITAKQMNDIFVIIE